MSSRGVERRSNLLFPKDLRLLRRSTPYDDGISVDILMKRYNQIQLNSYEVEIQNPGSAFLVKKHVSY